MINTKTSYKKELYYCLLSGVFCLLAAYISLGLYDVNLDTPFNYTEDSFGALMLAQNIITGNGFIVFPNMGAPGIFTIAASPDVLNIHVFGMWTLSLFIKDAGLLVNVFFILTFVTVSIAATVSLRLLNINPMTSILGGVLYSLLPYHFLRGVPGLFLSTYAVVPLACVLILWIMNGEIHFKKINFNDGKFLKNIFSAFPLKTSFSIIIAIYIGMVSPYYMFFSCLGIVFAIIWNFLNERNLKKVIAPSIILFIVVLTAVITLIPFIIYVLNGYETGLTSSRTLKDIEYYGLKFIRLILPTVGHRFNLFAKISGYYENNISITILNRNHGNSLGLFMSTGLIISLFIAMMRKHKNHDNINIHHSAVLNIFIILLGSIGGISSFIAFFISSARTYNRLSIFIAFFSLFIICYFLDNILYKLKLKTTIKLTVIIVIGILAALDQVGNKWPFTSEHETVSYYTEKYYSDKEFIKRIEEITPANSMIFQLPFVPSNHYAAFNMMQPYEQYTPFIHSNSLKWSYKAQLSSPAEKWQRYIANMPIEIMLKYLAGVGFKGIYIDKFGYLSDEYIKIKKAIIEITNVEPILSNNGRLEYFYLGEYLINLANTFNERQMKVYENWENLYIVPIIPDFNSVYESSNSFGGMLLPGWSDIESWGVWSDGNATQLGFVVTEKNDFMLNLNFHVFPEPLHFSIEVNYNKIGEYTVAGESDLEIAIKSDYLIEWDNVFTVVIQFHIQNPQSPRGDPRMLGIGLKYFEIKYAN